MGEGWGEGKRKLVQCLVQSLRTAVFCLLCGLLAGCSYHYNQGQELEAQDRWEEAAIEYLVELGYDYIHGPDIAPDGTSPERATYGDVIARGSLASW